MSLFPPGFRQRARISRAAAVIVLVGAGFASTGDAVASAGVRCGARITKNTTLTKDLHCKKDGLKIGAHGITLDLGGHDIVGPGQPGTVGILNPGYDGVVIDGYSGGTVRGFDRGIELKKDARQNEIVGMRVRAGRYGLVQFDSCTNTPRDPADERCGSRVDDNVITAGHADGGYTGGSGAAFALYRSHDNYFEENFSDGNGVNAVLLDNSHRNEITEFNFSQEIWDDAVGHIADFDPTLGTGLLLRNSDGNFVFGNIFAESANDGIFIDEKSTGNVVGGNLAMNNNKLGINVRGTVRDSGENRAFGNTWQAQCRGITCINE